MNLLVEQLIVGLFTSLIYLLLFFMRFKYLILLFLIGFLKHLLGYYVGLQDIYCNHHKPGTTAKVKLPELLFESFVEGLLFLIFGFILIKFNVNRNIIPFILGFTIHIISEFIGIHYIFIENRCKEM